MSYTPDTPTIGDTNRAGTVVITDTNWDSNGGLRVTVSELIGGYNGWVGGRTKCVRTMRDLARRALIEYYPGQTRSVRTLREWSANGSMNATFIVSRNR